MSWSAQLISIRDNPVPDGTKWIEVSFVYTTISPDVVSKQFQQRYQLSGGNFGNMTAVINFIANRVSDLNALQDTSDALISNAIVGSFIDPAAGGLLSSRSVVTNAQLKLALLNAGLYTTVDNQVQTMGNQAKIAWAYSPYFTIDSPFLASVASALGYSQSQLQNFFISAFAIKV